MRHLSLFATILAFAVAPHALRAQVVTPEEAADFVGNWAASIDSPQGSIDMNVDIVDADGTLEAWVQGLDGGMTLVDGVALDGGTLTLSYEVDFGGQVVPISLMLGTTDAGLDVTMSGAGGQFTADGTATLR